MDFSTGLTSREPSPKTDKKDLRLTEKLNNEVTQTAVTCKLNDHDLRMVEFGYEVTQTAVTLKSDDHDLVMVELGQKVTQTAVTKKSNDQVLAGLDNCDFSSWLARKIEGKALGLEWQGPSFRHNEIVTTSTAFDLALEANSQGGSISPDLDENRFDTSINVNLCESRVIKGDYIDSSKIKNVIVADMNLGSEQSLGVEKCQQCHLDVETFNEGLGQLYKHKLPRSDSDNQLEMDLKIGENLKADMGNNRKFEYKKHAVNDPLWNVKLEKINVQPEDEKVDEIVEDLRGKFDRNIVEKITLKECKDSSRIPMKISEKNKRKLGPNIMEKMIGFEKDENTIMKINNNSSDEEIVLKKEEGENLQGKETEKIIVNSDEKRRENWLEIAKKNLKKISEDSDEKKTPKSKHEKIYKHENICKTPGSSTKKTRKLTGNRKMNQVNEIKKLWDKKKENTDAGKVEKLAQLKPKVSSCKIEKIISSLDADSEKVKIKMSEIQKPTKLRSSVLLDQWLDKAQRVGKQAREVEEAKNVKDSKEFGLSVRGQEKPE